MTAALPAPARALFVKLCGMLGSHHDGERAAAAAKASELLQAHRLSWAEVLEADFPCPHCRARERENADGLAGHWRAVAARLLNEHSGLLTAWEFKFLRTVVLQDGLSAKQASVLDGLVAKARRRGR